MATTAAAISSSALSTTNSGTSQHESIKLEREAGPIESTPLLASTSHLSNGQSCVFPIASTPAILKAEANDGIVGISAHRNMDADGKQALLPQHHQGQKEPSAEGDEDAILLASLASSPLNDNTFGIASHVPPLTDLSDGMMLSPTKEEDPFSLPPAMTPADEDSSGPIQAYAKLEFPGFSYYIQTLECTIGRRPAHMRTPPNREGDSQHITGGAKMDGDVDVDLGLLKSISRLHVRIFYQEQSQAFSAYPSGMFEFGADDIDRNNGGRFVLQVLGRNGCFVDDVPVGKDAIVPLGKRTKIQIAERVFYFVLPPPPSTRRYNSDGELDSNASLHDSDEEEDEDDELEDEDESGSLGSSESEEDTSQPSEEVEEDVKGKEDDSVKVSTGAKGKQRPRLVLKKKVPPVQKGGKGKHQGKTVWPGQGKTVAEKRIREEEEENEEGGLSESGEAKVKKGGKGGNKKAKTSTSGKAAPVEPPLKRKRGDQSDGERKVALKVGTPIGVEAIDEKKKRRRKKKGDVEDAGTEANAAIAPIGKGKSGGKALIAAAAVAAKAKAEEESNKAKGSLAPLNTATDTNVRPRVATSAVPPSATRPPPVPTSNQQTGIARPGGPLSRPLAPTGVTANRPMPVSTPSNASKAGLSIQRPPSIGTAAVPRPLSNGVAPSTNFSPTPALYPSPSNGNPSIIKGNQSSAIPPATTSASTPTPLPPAGPGIKPDLSNMDLVRNALANPISMSRGGKLTLQEIYEDISSRYEWYRNNSRLNGRDWHSTMRHAVGNSKEMIRIPRKANEQGKGFFYAFKSSPAGQIYKKEAEISGKDTSPDQSTMTANSASSTPPSAAIRPSPAIPVVPVNAPVPSTPISSAKAIRPAVAPKAGPSTPIRPRPPVQAPARPSPPVQSSSRVSIVIGKAPAEALAAMAATPKAPITLNIEALFGGPPIVHHEGKLYLSPLVFGHMSTSEISDIGGKGAQQALAILQSHLVSHLQGKMKGGGTTAQGSASPVTGGGAKGASTTKPGSSVNTNNTTPRPVVAAPSLQQSSRPPPQSSATANSATSNPQRPTMPDTAIRPAQQSTGIARPQMSARPISAPSQVRPANSSASVGPAANAVQRPASNAVQSVARPAASSARPTSSSIVGPTAANSRPTEGNGPVQVVAQPVATSSAAVGQPNKSINVSSPAVGSIASRPPILNAASNVTRPSIPSATSNGAPRPRPPVAAAVPSQATGSAASNKAAPSASTPSANAMMNAMQALASHPDSAGLMTLLSGGKVGKGSDLTPGQLDLLQQAGRLAAEQQKIQQQQQQQQQQSKTIQPQSDSNTQSSTPASSKDIVTVSPTQDDTQVNSKNDAT